MEMENFMQNCTGMMNFDLNLSHHMLNATEKEINQMKILKTTKYYLYEIVIPLVCAFGFVGNILNVVIFSRKKNNKILDEVEYCTTICLVALAISDMMFCFCTFPNAFILERSYYDHGEFMLHYKLYSIAVISTFIMSSTLLTVLTAVMRYLAICHPFRSRQFISVKVTVLAIVVIAVVSVVFNIPTLFYFQTEQHPCPTSPEYVSIVPSKLFSDKHFVSAYKMLWVILGNFLPLAILLYCNIRLIRALHQSKQLRLLHSRDDTSCLSAHRRINITLITIIILFFLLVAPSEITKFISYIINEKKKDMFTSQMVAMVTNTLQTINFSVNFILYYVIIAPFRRTLHEFVCALYIRRRSTETRDPTSNSGKQTIMLLSVKEQQQNFIA